MVKNTYQKGAHGYAIAAAYEVDGAGYLVCPTCEAESGRPCLDEGLVRKIPHYSRLRAAYREANGKKDPDTTRRGTAR